VFEPSCGQLACILDPSNVADSSSLDALLTMLTIIPLVLALYLETPLPGLVSSGVQKVRDCWQKLGAASFMALKHAYKGGAASEGGGIDTTAAPWAGRTTTRMRTVQPLKDRPTPEQGTRYLHRQFSMSGLVTTVHASQGLRRKAAALLIQKMERGRRARRDAFLQRQCVAEQREELEASVDRTRLKERPGRDSSRSSSRSASMSTRQALSLAVAPAPASAPAAAAAPAPSAEDSGGGPSVAAVVHAAQWISHASSELSDRIKEMTRRASFAASDEVSLDETTQAAAPAATLEHGTEMDGAQLSTPRPLPATQPAQAASMQPARQQAVDGSDEAVLRA
jgi:hypothetical protein